MPMIDIYAARGTFPDPHEVAQAAAKIVKDVEQVPDIPMFRQNTAAFVHELAPDSFANVEGTADHVRVQVLTNAGALDRDKQLVITERLTQLVADHSGDPDLGARTWVLLTEAVPGGWGLWGHAHTNDELVTAARTEIARLQS